MQAVHKQPSCLAHPFCSDGSSFGHLAPCLQTDCSKRNTQWPDILCQHCWSQSNYLLTKYQWNLPMLYHAAAIAWLNLDFGIEACFYDGMDAYSKRWLQYVFPTYLWLLVGLMILISNFLHTFARLLGNNPVSVLHGNTHSSLICKDPPHIDHCDIYHLHWIPNIQLRGVAVWCKYWLPCWQTNSTLLSGSACFPLSLSSLHSLASLWLLAAGHITL